MSDYYRDAFANLPTPCAIVDGSGRLAAVNDAFAATIGQSADALEGRAATAILDGLPDDLGVRRHDVTVDIPLSAPAALRMACSIGPLPGGGAVLNLRPAPEMAGWPYQLIVEAIEGGITIRAADGRIIGSNAAARQLLGHGTAPEFIRWDGMPLAAADHPAMMALESDSPVAAIIGASQPEGGVRWLQVHSVPIRHPGGGRAVVSSFAEINQLVDTQRRLAESERRFRAIFDQTFEFIGLLRTNGTLIEANRTALEYIGAELPDVAGRHFADTPWWSHSADARLTLRAGILEAAAGRFVRFETTHPGADGTVATIDFSLKPVFDDAGQVVFIIPEGRDISHLKRTQQELLAAKLQAEAASRAKSAFLASMSHELRTPLNAVIGFSETMRERMFGPLDNPRYEEYVGLIHSAGSHLRDVIEDILDVARIEIGGLELHETVLNLRPNLEGALAMIRPKADERRVELVADLAPDLPRLRADELRLRQIVLNLLSNAVKFTPPGGQVRLSAWADGDGLAIAVGDTGIGIRPEDMENIWTPFFQADATLSRRFGGTGLGLPIVRHYVEAHGGTITVDSMPGQGTTFIVRLPAGRVLARSDEDAA